MNSQINYYLLHLCRCIHITHCTFRLRNNCLFSYIQSVLLKNFFFFLLLFERIVFQSIQQAYSLANIMTKKSITSVKTAFTGRHTVVPPNYEIELNFELI